MIFGRRNLTAVALLAALLSACGAHDGPVDVSVADAGGKSALADAGACSPQSCDCAGLSGHRSCDDAGQLGSCECPAVSASPPDAAVSFLGSCPTGRYEGNFEGEAGFLIALGPVSGADLFDDQAPLQITLSPGQGNEFVVVGDGLMRGNANGAFPFEAMIKGKLDCDTKRFKATLVGSVQLFADAVSNDFTGTMESTYDPTVQAFTAGAWTVTGSDADGGVDFGLTGSGSWTAQHVADAGADAGL